MAKIIKTAITQLLLGDPVHPDYDNQPHLDLEQNIDDILTYLNAGSLGDFEYDATASSGLTFAYTAGDFRKNNVIVTIGAGSRSLSTNLTSYIQINPVTGLITHNTTGFTSGSIPLWQVTTDATSMTAIVDKRTILSSHVTLTDNGNLLIGTTTDDAVNKLQITGSAKISAIMEAATVKITSTLTNTFNNRVSLYDGGNEVQFGMTLWNTNTTTGEWSTMIYGPNAANRRISFGKVNSAGIPTLHAHISEIAYFDLDDSYLYSTGGIRLAMNSSAVARDYFTVVGTGNNNAIAMRINSGESFISFVPRPAGVQDLTREFGYSFTDSRWMFDTTPYVGTNPIWHNGNQGAGTGMDSDTVDNLHATSFVRRDLNTQSNSFAGNYLTFIYNGASDIDHIRFDEATNRYHFCADVAYGAAGNANIFASSFNGSLVGNASSATILQTARTFDITGDITCDAVSFNGSGNVTLIANVNNDSHTHDTRYVTLTGTAAAATKLATARNFDITGAISCPSVNFDGTGNVNLVATVLNDSHTHDGRYYTKTESDARYTQSVSIAYPVGSIYLSITSTNPATTLGFGTWIRIARGRTLIGEGTSDRYFPANEIAGESAHTLTIDEMPSHDHRLQFLAVAHGTGEDSSVAVGTEASPNGTVREMSYPNHQAKPTGGGGTHNNLPPYHVIYIWQRTA